MSRTFLATVTVCMLLGFGVYAELEPHGTGPRHDDYPSEADEGGWVYGPYASQYSNCNFGVEDGKDIFGCEDYWGGGTQYGTLSIDYYSCQYNGGTSMLQNCPSTQPDTNGDSPTWDCTQSTTNSAVHVCNRND
jgi:hypothetical protein